MYSPRILCRCSATKYIGARIHFFTEDNSGLDNVSFNYPVNYNNVKVVAEAAGKIFLSTGGFIVKKEIFKTYRGYDKTFESAEDLDFSIKMLHAGTFSWSKEFVMVNKRRHAGNTDDYQLYEASYKISQYYIDKLKSGELPNFKKGRSKLISNLYERLLKDCINLNKKSTGTGYFIKTIGADLSKLFSPSVWKLWMYLVLFSGKDKNDRRQRESAIQ